MSNEHIFNKSKQVWENNLKLSPQTKLHYPDENLVRLFSGRYILVPQPPAKVMDHGFGSANTLDFLVSRGYDCSGCEISEHIIKEARSHFTDIGKAVDLRLVEGLDLPFESNSFDVVVSWNVIHYNGKRTAVQKVINELNRVLKPKGVLLLSTIHPNNSLIDRMRPLGGNSYFMETSSQYDNRQGLTFFCAPTVEHLAIMFDEFIEVKTGSATADLFNPEERCAWYLVYAIK